MKNLNSIHLFKTALSLASFLFSLNSNPQQNLSNPQTLKTDGNKEFNAIIQGNPLTLEAAMNLAEDYSFTAKIAEQDFLIVESQENSAFRSLFPTISSNASYTINSDSVNKLIGTTVGTQAGLPDKTSMLGSISLSQPIIGLYSSLQALQQASALSRASLQNKAQSKIEARFSGAQAFINAQKANQLLKTAKSSVEVAEKQLSDGNAQYQAGKLTHADLLKFKLEVENSKTSYIQAQTTYKITLMTLAEAIGIRNYNSIVLNNSEQSVWETKLPAIPSLESILEQALAQRHDVLAAKENVLAANYGKQQKYSTYLPSLNFVATYSRNFSSKDISVNSVIYSAKDIQDTFSYGVQFSWVIWDWGIRQSQINSTVAAEQKAKYVLENLNLNVRIDITNSYLQLQNAIQVLDSAKLSVQYAQDVYLQMKARFDNGQVTATDLISSANAQTTARANLANSKGALDLAWISFQKSLGKRLTTLN